MSVFLLWRAVFFVLLVLLNGTICATAALNLMTANAPGAPSTGSLDIYLIVLSALSLVFLFPIILIETLRRGALTSKVWFECCWLALLWLANLVGAAVTISLSPTVHCPAGSSQICASMQLLVVTTWITTLLLLSQFLLMMITSMIYRTRHSEVWTSSVKDFQWFRGGGNTKSTVLGSGPPTPTFANNPVPHLERVARHWQPEPIRPKPVRAAGVEREMTQSALEDPQPLTYAYAPEMPPSRAPMHYKASASGTVGTLPLGRKASKRKQPAAMAPAAPAGGPSRDAQTLYPQSVQKVMNGAPERNDPLRSPRSPPIVAKTGSHNVVVAVEPLPIKNWPRQNPQAPVRPSKRSVTTPAAPTIPPPPPPPAPTTETPPNSFPLRAVLEPTPISDPAPTRPFGPRPPRRRPAPLDLTAALPGASKRR